jgi:cell division protein FtsB
MTRSYWINRTLCNVLEEMRACHKTRNYSSLLSLIEEAQSMGNRMESALGDKRDVREMQEERQELKAEIKKLRDVKEKLGGKDASSER